MIHVFPTKELAKTEENTNHTLSSLKLFTDKAFKRLVQTIMLRLKKKLMVVHFVSMTLLEEYIVKCQWMKHSSKQKSGFTDV